MSQGYGRATQVAAWLCFAAFFCMAGTKVAQAQSSSPSNAPALGQFGAGWHARLPQLLVVDYHLVSKTPVPGTPAHNPQYEYVYRVDVRNNGATAANVSGHARSKLRHVDIVDADVQFGTVRSKEVKASADTFSLRAGKYFDRRLDRRVVRNGRRVFEEAGTDPSDTMGPAVAELWPQADLAQAGDAWYQLKLIAVIEWRLQANSDTAAPVISATSPQGNVRTTQPVISAAYTDGQGRIDTSQVVLNLDGVAVTSGATVSSSAVSYTPPAALAQGQHTVALSVADGSGNVGVANWSFFVDSLAPVVSGQGPRDTSSATVTSTITAQFQDAGSGVDTTSVQLVVDNIDVTAAATRTSTTVGYAPAGGFTAGTHQVVLRLRDIAGNAAESAWSFSVDASAPVVSNALPANGATLPADSKPAISASFSDGGAGVDVARVRLLLDGRDVTAGAQVSTAGISYVPAEALPEGSHSVRLVVADRNGNSGETQWSFVTRTLPAITAFAPVDVLVNATSPVTVTAQYGDVGSGIDTSGVKLMLDGVDVTPSVQVGETSLSFSPGNTLPQGLHVLVLSVADKAGNTASATWRFTLDSGLPVVSEQQPKNTLISAAQPSIAATFQDGGETGTASGIDLPSVRLFVDEADVTAQAVVSGAGPHSISYTPAQPLANGSHTVKLRVSDKAANAVESVWSFSVDASGPSITITAPADGREFAADELPAMAAELNDGGSGVDLASLVVQLDGQVITSQVRATATGFSYSPAIPLPEGDHTLVVSVRDAAGNQSSRTTAFRTRSAPVIGGQAPMDTFLPGGAAPLVTAVYSDVGAGVDAAKVRLLFNGVDVTAQAAVTGASISYAVPQPLPDATHVARLSVTDLAGNETTSEWRFGTAQAPEITGASPKDVVLSPTSRPTIAATFGDARSGIDPGSVHLIVNGEDVTKLAAVTATGISYTPTQDLAPGPYTVYLEVANRANAATSQVWGFEVDVPKVYDVRITSPGGPQSVLEPRIELTAEASANKTYPTRMTLAGREMTPRGVSSSGTTVYGTTVDLIDGVNTLEVVATFDDGQTRHASVQVSYDAPARITITSPADKAMLGRALSTSPGDLTGTVERPVTVTGRLSKPVRSVTLNQQQATLSNGGTEFSFPNFYLREGTNMITAVAVDMLGRTSSVAITVSVDQTAPILAVEAPFNGSVTSSAKLDVRGMVNDAVEGFAGAPEPVVTVHVNGSIPAGVKPAQVADRYFVVADVPLAVGENSIVVTARDQFGNARAQEIRVSRIAVGSERLTMGGGNHQAGPIGSELPKPLSVVALSAAGEPLANMPVRFDVLRGTGSISTQQGADTKVNGATAARNLVVNTDAFGRAQVWFKLGKQSGPGANVVQARHEGLGEAVTFVATSQRGAVAKVNADLGINQFAETGGQPLELMSVIVRDRDDNPLPGVTVVYRVEEGDAFFADTPGASASDNGQRIVLTTDKNGLVAVRPWIGNTPGLVRVSAKAVKAEGGNPDSAADLTGNAVFQVQAMKAVDGPASFKGHVYTDKGAPLAGVRVSIGRTALSSTTDERGAFELNDVPPGRIDLFVDGRTVNPTNDPARAQWPSLHFEAYAVKGQENGLAHPIYLPPLLTGQAKVVGGNEDVILTIPGVEGFQMKVKANSVTFPDGSRVGTLVVSPVTADKLPMAPPAGGATFGVPAWTIQPAGARFDPPIEVTLPNAGSQPPGDNVPIVQWDHDLGQYVPMGRATVSEDGAVMVTDVGSGITKAGWGGLCRYDPDKCGKNAQPRCQACESVDTSGECPTCKADAAKNGTKCDDNKCNRCKDGKCEADPKEDGQRIANFGGQIAFDLAVNGGVRMITRQLGVILESKFSLNFPYGVEEACCSASRAGTASKVEAQGTLQWEGMAAFPLLPVLKRVAGFLFSDSISGPSAVLKVAVQGGGSISYDQCKAAKGERPGSVDGKFVGVLEFIPLSVGGDFRYSQRQLGGSVVNQEGELRPLDIGVSGSAEFTPTKIVPNGVRTSGSAFASVFVKSQISIGTFNWSILDLSFPLYQGTIPDFDIPVPGIR